MSSETNYNKDNDLLRRGAHGKIFLKGGILKPGQLEQAYSVRQNVTKHLADAEMNYYYLRRMFDVETEETETTIIEDFDTGIRREKITKISRPINSENSDDLRKLYEQDVRLRTIYEKELSTAEFIEYLIRKHTERYKTISLHSYMNAKFEQACEILGKYIEFLIYMVRPVHDLEALKKVRLSYIDDAVNKIYSQYTYNVPQAAQPTKEELRADGINTEITEAREWLLHELDAWNRIQIKKYIDYLEQYAETPDNSDVEFIRKSINKKLSEIKESTFLSDGDYNKFRELLISFFYNESYTLPAKSIRVKNKSQGSTVTVLRSIYDDGARMPLQSNVKFLELLKVLSCFSEKTTKQIYKALTH